MIELAWASPSTGIGFQSAPTSPNYDPHIGGKIFLHNEIGSTKVQVRTGYVRFALICLCEIFRVSSHFQAQAQVRLKRDWPLK